MKKTNDGSFTFYSSEFGEYYHSVSGAIEESFEKFVKPCKLKNGSKVLDLFFGIGYNSLAAICLFDRLNIIGIEINKKIISNIKDISVPEEFSEKYEIIKKVGEKLVYKDDNYDIKLIIGDVLNEVSKLNSGFDAVFFDAFSIKKHPEVWTSSFFKLIRSKMKKNCCLTTYSCARKVRDNLIEAGFEVFDVAPVGRRGPSTLAINI